MTQLERALDRLETVVVVPLSEQELRAARQLLIDTVGCALGGADDPVARGVALALGADGTGGASGVRILGSETRLRPADALLVHGAAIRCLDFNDVSSFRNNLHPSENVIPAVLALAEIEGWNGRRTVEAIALGYRVVLAVGEMWEGLLKTGWAPAATLGRISTAAFVALLRGLPRETVANAMAIATITAPTLGAVFKGQLSHTKSMVNGMAGRAGWEAVDLANAGLTGPLDAFESAGGYDTLVAGEFIEPSADDRLLTCADVSIKAYPTVFMIHCSIASAIELHTRLGGQLGEVSAMRVYGSSSVIDMAAADNRWTATTREEAQFSLPLAVATSLVHGACGFPELELDSLKQPEVARILALMGTVVEPEWTGYEQARVEVELADGTVIVSETSAPPGNPRNPLTEQQLLGKFRALSQPVIGVEATNAVETVLAGIEAADDILALFDAARPSSI